MSRSLPTQIYSPPPKYYLSHDDGHSTFDQYLSLQAVERGPGSILQEKCIAQTFDESEIQALDRSGMFGDGDYQRDATYNVQMVDPGSSTWSKGRMVR